MDDRARSLPDAQYQAPARGQLPLSETGNAAIRTSPDRTTAGRRAAVAEAWTLCGSWHSGLHKDEAVASSRSTVGETQCLDLQPGSPAAPAPVQQVVAWAA